MVDEPLWTSPETATALNLAEQTLANWRWRGIGPPYLKMNGAVRYQPAAVREWQSGQLRRSTSDPGSAK